MKQKNISVIWISSIVPTALLHQFQFYSLHLILYCLMLKENSIIAYTMEGNNFSSEGQKF